MSQREALEKLSPVQRHELMRHTLRFDAAEELLSHLRDRHGTETRATVELLLSTLVILMEEVRKPDFSHEEISGWIGTLYRDHATLFERIVAQGEALKNEIEGGPIH